MRCNRGSREVSCRGCPYGEDDDDIQVKSLHVLLERREAGTNKNGESGIVGLATFGVICEL